MTATRSRARSASHRITGAILRVFRTNVTRLFRTGGADAVAGFISQHPEIWEMDREGIRDLVTECICILERRPVPEKRDRTPNLPGWESLLDGHEDAGSGIRRAVTCEKRAGAGRESAARMAGLRTVARGEERRPAGNARASGGDARGPGGKNRNNRQTDERNRQCKH